MPQHVRLPDTCYSSQASGQICAELVRFCITENNLSRVHHWPLLGTARSYPSLNRLMSTRHLHSGPKVPLRASDIPGLRTRPQGEIGGICYTPPFPTNSMLDVTRHISIRRCVFTCGWRCSFNNLVALDTHIEFVDIHCCLHLDQ